MTWQIFMELLKASVTDAKAISELITPLVSKYILPSCSDQGAEILLNSMNSASIEQYILAGYQYQLAIVNGEIVGVVGVRDNSHLYHLFVREDYQGKGLAILLWEAAKKECFEQGNKGVFTVNSAINSAQLYRKLGFKDQSGIRERSGIKDIPMQLTMSKSPV